jgi:hypothetical protein
MPPNSRPVAGPGGQLVPGRDPEIENETFNVLKTKGYNLERNFG